MTGAEWFLVALVASWWLVSPDPAASAARSAALAAGAGGRAAGGRAYVARSTARQRAATARQARWSDWRKTRTGKALVLAEQVVVGTLGAVGSGLVTAGLVAGSALAGAVRAAPAGARAGWVAASPAARAQAARGVAWVRRKVPGARRAVRGVLRRPEPASPGGFVDPASNPSSNPGGGPEPARAAEPAAPDGVRPATPGDPAPTGTPEPPRLTVVPDPPQTPAPAPAPAAPTRQETPPVETYQPKVTEWSVVDDAKTDVEDLQRALLAVVDGIEALAAHSRAMPDRHAAAPFGLGPRVEASISALVDATPNPAALVSWVDAATHLLAEIGQVQQDVSEPATQHGVSGDVQTFATA